jgi:ketosteroid isomerase-like protein
MSAELTISTADRNTQLIQDFYTHVDAGEVTAMGALFTPGARYYRPGYAPLASRDEIERFYREERTIRDGHHTLERVVATDGDVAVRGSFAGHLRDGRRAEHRFAEFFTVSPDGRLSRRDTFFFVPLV